MKCIDAEKLKAEIQWRIGLYHERGCGCDNAIEESLEELVSFINSLQQEQPEVDEQEYGPYARQYPKSKVSQEQPEVDLEKEILDWIGDEGSCKNGKWTWYECNKMIRHFYKLGLNTRKEE